MPMQLLVRPGGHLLFCTSHRNRAASSATRASMSSLHSASGHQTLADAGLRLAHLLTTEFRLLWPILSMEELKSVLLLVSLGLG